MQGSSHSLGIKPNNSLWAWGSNRFGQVGNGSPGNNRYTPQAINGSYSFSSVSAGRWHSLAIRSDGTLFGWGNNWSGQVGFGPTRKIVSRPQDVESDTSWSSVSGGIRHSLGIRSDGTLWAWGGNRYGQLGIGNTQSPILIPTLVVERN